MIEGSSKYFLKTWSHQLPKNGGWTIVTVSRFPQTIGVTQAGVATRYVTYVWRNGYLVTMHPGKPSASPMY
jgi:hypothetical protein